MAYDPPRPGERIAKLLARAGIASRREVERMIGEGRIALNGEALTTAATVLPDLRGVTVDGKPVAAPAPARLFVFHKPTGLLTTERDPAGRPTIYAALRNALPPGTPRLMPVGRLDFNTEGLLLLTNDGGLKRSMELPSSGVPRTYRARAAGSVSQAQLEDLIEGITIEGVRYGRIDANLERRTGHNQWIELTLSEGKNREVRRVLEHLDLTVSRLIRVAYGPFTLGDLPRGAAAEVPRPALDRFRRTLPGGLPEPDPVPLPETGAAEAGARTPERKPTGKPAAPRPPRDGESPPPQREPGAGKPSAPRPVRRDGKPIASKRETRDGKAPPSQREPRAGKPPAPSRERRWDGKPAAPNRRPQGDKPLVTQREWRSGNPSGPQRERLEDKSPSPQREPRGGKPSASQRETRDRKPPAAQREPRAGKPSAPQRGSRGDRPPAPRGPGGKPPAPSRPRRSPR